MRKIIAVFFLFFTYQILAQQPLVSGPMLGYIEHREALIWLEVSPDVKKVAIRFQEKGKIETAKTIAYEGVLGKRYNPIKIALAELNMNTAYEYDIFLNDKKAVLPFATTFKTKKLWEWRENAPDFSFSVGSCFYMNDPTYDRPGKPYGQDPRILETMGNMPTDFMLWTGDNLYLREADYSSEAGIAYRYSFNFRQPQMQKLRASRANYAVWDDHDYGPNDSDGAYELKEVALETFKKYWGNKSFGEPDNKGVYTKFRWSDCDFFMMDDRYYRSADDMPDSIGGKPNPNKVFYGKKQLEWLKNSLISSNATFKFIISGGQMLNPMAKDKECFMAYPAEWQELMDFIVANKIKDLVFISGDRHFSELLKYQPTGFYPLHEFTCSAVTSSVATPNKAEQANPLRVAGTLLLENNFGKISVSGEKNKRQVLIETYDINGVKKWGISINENDLKK
jgi:alkaline phosphatase D